MASSKATAEEARSLLTYDPLTGIFRWKWRPGTRIQWNARYAGQIAGCFSEDYNKIRFSGHVYCAHRLAYLMIKGHWPSNEIDHIEKVTGKHSDNRWANLRDASHSANLANQGAHVDNKLGLKGVCFRKDRRKYHAQICVRRKQIHLGFFDCPAAAHLAYVIAADRSFKEFARSA